MAEVVEPALLAVALAGGVDEGQVARLADAVGAVLGALEEPLFQRDGDVLGKPMPTKPPVATVSPERMSCTASAGGTALPSFIVRSALRR